MDGFPYRRRKTSPVFIGNIPLGGDNPVRIQSMTTASTLDTEACIAQCIRITDAGGDFVRLTAQGVREAENLKNIRDGLRQRGCRTPLAADIHYNPDAAYTAAAIVDKVRINPGNFAGENDMRARLLPLLDICKEHHTAIRIGVNHGSLSERILRRYGDTPEGMTESCMEYLRLCLSEQFTSLVVSVKASSAGLMVATVRMLAARMDAEGMPFPLHLGVTEAGDGDAARIKSAVGIGTLLMEGVGDTVRVSLSEDPAAEIPVARALVAYAANGNAPAADINFPPPPYPTAARRAAPPVITDAYPPENSAANAGLLPDFIYINEKTPHPQPAGSRIIVDCAAFTGKPDEHPLFRAQDGAAWDEISADAPFLLLHDGEISEAWAGRLRRAPHAAVILSSQAASVFAQRAALYRLRGAGVENVVVVERRYEEASRELFQLKAATDFGALLLDDLAGGMYLRDASGAHTAADVTACSYGILQATGRRITGTEYIACPGCGRTLFDLQTALQRVKAATAGLRGLKIGVMGCIVNGPGEMADADFGYVGSGRGRVSLYKGKVCVKKNIPEEDAVNELLRLIGL
jgi:(E)-4-hydroxy-3-methylbut-2-enyl-diphosphate synthase